MVVLLLTEGSDGAGVELVDGEDGGDDDEEEGERARHDEGHGVVAELGDGEHDDAAHLVERVGRGADGLHGDADGEDVAVHGHAAAEGVGVGRRRDVRVEARVAVEVHRARAGSSLGAPTPTKRSPCSGLIDTLAPNDVSHAPGGAPTPYISCHPAPSVALMYTSACGMHSPSDEDDDEDEEKDESLLLVLPRRRRTGGSMQGAVTTRRVPSLVMSSV